MTPNRLRTAVAVEIRDQAIYWILFSSKGYLSKRVLGYLYYRKARPTFATTFSGLRQIAGPATLHL